MPFGEAFVDEHATTTTMPYKFNGKEQDAETGLYYYGARYYDPKICVFYGVDPMTDLHEDFSPFVYCYNNPIRFVDPLGLDTLNFDESGKYIKTITAAGEHVGKVAGENGCTFIFADQTWAGEFTTEEFPMSEEMGGDGGRYNSIYLVPKEIIDKIIEDSGVKDANNQKFISKYIYALKESRGINKKMDYVNNKSAIKMQKGNPYSLFVTDSQGLKVAHDNFNFGNFLWGAGMKSLTIPYIDAITGAHADNMIHNWLQPDSKDDQISIFFGYLYK
jgi:RHS repeat-associated protein